jgi:serralysin
MPKIVNPSINAAEGEEFDRNSLSRDYDVLSNQNGIADFSPLSFNLDDYSGLGLLFRGKEIADLDRVVNQIDSGNAINLGGKTVITFTFNSLDHLVGVYNNKNFGFGAPNGFSPFSDTQKAEARESIALWDDLVAPSFKETNGLGADIQFANSFDPAQAYAYYPGNPNYLFRSDVFVATPVVNWTNAWLGFNGYGATTLIHELGHAIGLSHPGAYNFDPTVPQNYVGLAEYAQDSGQYSVMSYWRGRETGANIVDWGTFLLGNAQTPLLHDILTIQTKYGADPTTRSGNTVYGFNSTAGNAVYDFSQNAYPNLSIYDAGGNDTIDLSGFNQSVFLNLHAGSFSSAAQAAPSLAQLNANRAALTQLATVEDPALSGFPPAVFGPISAAAYAATLNNFAANGAAKILADTGVAGVTALAYDNISIAYGTTIENGIGGSARDVIWGNEVANRLDGRGGDDVIDGFEGADWLTGGAGADTFAFRFIEKGDTITDFATGSDKIDLRGTAVDFTFVGNAAFTNTAGELRFDNGQLMGDVNGDGIADLVIYVQGSGVVAGDLLIL